MCACLSSSHADDSRLPSTAKSIEYMIVDALLKADPLLKISERIFNPKKFMFLTDDIILEVERSESPVRQNNNNKVYLKTLSYH